MLIFITIEEEINENEIFFLYSRKFGRISFENIL